MGTSSKSRRVPIQCIILSRKIKKNIRIYFRFVTSMCIIRTHATWERKYTYTHTLHRHSFFEINTVLYGS